MKAMTLNEVLAKYDPNEPRDDQGQWTEGGGSSGADHDESGLASGLRAADDEDMAYNRMHDALYADPDRHKTTDLSFWEKHGVLTARDHTHATEMGRDAFDHAKNVNMAEMAALDDHAGGMHSGKKDDALDSLISRSTANKDMVLFHGAKDDRQWSLKDHGSTITMPGYTSTSLKQSFARRTAGDEGNHYQIHVPKGSAALPVNQHIATDDIGSEVLLPHDSKFKVMAVDPENRTVRLSALKKKA